MGNRQAEPTILANPEPTMDLSDKLQASLGDAYVIERELGGGGMSRVFVAEETALGRRVVVKVLPEELSGSVSIARFRREIALAARLQHPHIVALISAGEVDGLPYFTMPFVDGESLRARLSHGELPIAEVVAILRDVAKALAYAHDKGVTHRDIKPDNVLLAGSSAVITDFGVAKALNDSTTDAQLTSIGVALGTPAYMAPEQAAADPATDQRADIYAVGAMAYEMLAGHPPFAGRNAQAVLAAHATEAPTSIGTLRAATPPALGDLVMRCLEKRPGDRPQGANEILHALDNLTPLAGSAPPRIAAAALRRTNSGGRTRSIAVVAGALLCLGVLGAWWRMHSADSSPDDIRSIAVLPFENRSGDTTFNYLEDGVTDHVRDALNAIPGLTVKARSSSQHMKGHGAHDIGVKLGVAAVVQGTFSRSGSRLHVTTELVRTSDDNALWSHTFDGASTELPGVQDTIARAVVSTLHLGRQDVQQLSGNGARGTADAEAYDLFLRGRHARDRFDIPRALSLFREAAKRDPHFARAIAFLAMSYADSPILGLMTIDSAMTLTRETAARAKAIDSTVVETYIAEAFILSSDYTRLGEALVPLEKGLSIDSGNVDLLWNYGFALALVGREQDALVQARRARAKDPLRVIGIVGGILIMTHQFDEALADIRATLALDPAHVLGYRELGILYAFTGKPDSSLAAFKTAFKLDSTDFGNAANLVFGFAVAGQWKDAQQQRALNARRAEGNSPNYRHAVEDIAFGEYDAAMTALEQAVTHGDPVFGTVSIPCNLLFDPLKANPRFDALMRRMGAHACPATGTWPIKPPRARAR
ncbi:MAG: tetratricopeptide repeat-containing serine/threonine-protein kinase [Gemmatimonadota bacterium]|nr:tetratricopeptide repeat-containing serine/threonine-protein kinase [Gemmatimonadota bacterium]